jgi:peptidyl-prolyl cis-trans isomerase B (cyclophilin B)
MKVNFTVTILLVVAFGMLAIFAASMPFKTTAVRAQTEISQSEDEENELDESTSEPEDIVGENDPRIVEMFKKYPTWPPEKISKDDVELLNKAVVNFQTTKGLIKIKVFPEDAPLNSANFVKLSSDGFYDGITFHRVIKGFMSQGGDPTGTGAGGPTPDYTLPAEIGLPHVAGSVAAARTNNPEERGSGSQFYLCHSTEGCSMLDGKYTVFGQIIEGQDVNLSLNVTYDHSGPIQGVEPDKIIKAWVEVE